MTLRTVAEWLPLREAAVAGKAAAEARIGEGDEGGVAALDVAIREIKRLDLEIEHAKTLEKARADAARVREASVARLELAEVEKEIAARRPLEMKHADGLARAKIAAEALERDGLAVYAATEQLLNRKALLISRIEGRQARGGGGLNSNEFRFMLDTERVRQSILPFAPPTDLARQFLSRPAKPAPARGPATDTSNETTATTRSRRTR